MFLLLLACNDPAEDSALRRSGAGPGSDTDAGCPEGLICVDHFPWSGSGDTRSSARSEFDQYACAPTTDESGAEIVYRLDVPTDGLLALSLDDRGDDVDVHLLSALDADACVDRGNLGSASWVTAGTWYVVIDSWVDGAGAPHPGQYDLWMNVTTPDAYVSAGLDADVFGLGLGAFDVAWEADETERFEFTVIDFSRPSDQARQWTVDLADGSLLYRLLMSHGEGSGSASDPRYADTFSNEDGSHMSSLGLMRTAARYEGSNGTSLTLEGLEPGINDAAEARAIVVHGADYATQAFVDEYGYLGRSWGCPAVDTAVIDDLITDVEDGSLYWSYYPDPAFLSRSGYL